MKINLISVLSLLLLISCQEPSPTEAPPPKAPINYLSAYRAINPDSSINAVIEIPAGTNAKWETDKSTGQLVWEQKEGKPRIVQYLPYPANYGMIPGTLLPKEKGGDGDPLDILVLGPAVERGTVLRVQVIGVMKLLDRGEQDDKLIGVDPEGPLGQVASMEELESKFPQALQIIELWFTNYKGAGKMEFLGMGEQDEAMGILRASLRVEKIE
jgi:inorganic pyrophosphatase